MRCFRILTAIALVLVAVPAAAQEAPGSAPQRDTLDLDEDSKRKSIIEGKEYLPDFTVLIDREDLSRAYDLELDESFLPKIIEAVNEEPF